MDSPPNEAQKLTILAEQLIRHGDIEGAKALISCNTNLGLASLETEKYLAKFYTQDKDTLDVKEQIRLLSQVDDPVIIEGPSGTGKNILAHALHGNRKGRLVTINCAGLPEELVESELFGYEKGAFTGAYNDRIGLMEAAKDGTLFLDEVGDMVITAQAKFLVAVQEQQIRRVGGKDYIPINCRIVCATHHNLEDDVEKGKFRLDLYERLRTFEITIKSLKERGEVEVNHIAMELFNGRDTRGRYLPEEIRDNIMLDFMGGMLKGNVRSLQRIIRRYEVLKLRRITK